MMLHLKQRNGHSFKYLHVTFCLIKYNYHDLNWWKKLKSTSVALGIIDRGGKNYILLQVSEWKGTETAFPKTSYVKVKSEKKQKEMAWAETEKETCR